MSRPCDDVRDGFKGMNQMGTLKNVQEIAALVRRIVAEATVELVKGVGNFPQASFPRGWCQDTSRALGHLLDDRGEHGFQLVFGARPEDDRKTHVWLERNGLIVDITADQFENSGCPSVMATTDRTWHDGWRQRTEPLDEVLPGHADSAIYSAVARHPSWLASALNYPPSKLA